jgi:hypothetical protein
MEVIGQLQAPAALPPILTGYETGCSNSWPRGVGEDKTLRYCWESNSGRPACNLVTILSYRSILKWQLRKSVRVLSKFFMLMFWYKTKLTYKGNIFKFYIEYCLFVTKHRFLPNCSTRNYYFGLDFRRYLWKPKGLHWPQSSTDTSIQQNLAYSGLHGCPAVYSKLLPAVPDFLTR